MTELVERLRKQAWQRSGAPKMDAGHAKMLEWEAADEIERLEAENNQLYEQLEQLHEQLAEATAGIERLRRELSYHAHTDEDIKVQNDEIERLQLALKTCRELRAYDRADLVRVGLRKPGNISDA